MIDSIKARLQKTSAQFIGREREENIIYGSQETDAKGSLVRIRKTDEKALLTYKRRTDGYGDVKHQIEHECEISDATVVDAILAELDLTPRLVYEKKRETWKFKSVEI